MGNMHSKRVAIVHDWLPLYGGAERVLEQILAVFPQADLFAMIDGVPPKERAFLHHKTVQTSLIQRLPGARTHYRRYFPFMPLAVEQFDLRAYDLILSSSYAVAKGVLTGPQQLHICYCHSPARYAWDLQSQYLEEAGLARGCKGWLTRMFLHYFRLWDMRSAAGVDHFLANSRFVARRIHKVYRRQATVIHPPVDSGKFTRGGAKDDFYFTASRLVPYKRIDLIVEAFARMPGRRLIVLGDGPEMAKVRSKAGPNVELLGYRDDAVMRDHLQRARAFVFAAEEDFGIVPVEAQACGTPVIAFGKGGARETVIAGETGIFFEEQTVEGVCRAVEEFEGKRFDPAKVRANAERFSPARFRAEFANFVQARWSEFESAL